MPVNDRNSDAIFLQATDIQTRNEPNLAAGIALPTFMLGAQMRYLFPFSSVINTGTVYDFSQQGRQATVNPNAPTYLVFGLTPYANFNGANQGLVVADAVALRPTTEFTAFQWIRVYNAATLETFHHKGDLTGATNAYWFRKTAGNAWEFLVSAGGGVGAAVPVTSTIAVTINKWFFIAGRFNGGNQMDIWVNDPNDRNNLVQTSLAVGVPANAFASNNNVIFGRGGGPAQYCQCDMAFVGGYHAILSNTVVENWYNQSRALFGV